MGLRDAAAHTDPQALFEGPLNKVHPGAGTAPEKVHPIYQAPYSGIPGTEVLFLCYSTVTWGEGGLQAGHLLA